MSKIAACLLGLALTATACGGDPTSIRVPEPTTTESGGTGGLGSGRTAAVGFANRLVPFADCSELLVHFQSEAMARVGPWGLDLGGHFGPIAVEELAEADVDTTADVAGEEPAQGGGDDGQGRIVGTNTQEVGVDEPDLVKTDGDRIVVALNGEVTIFATPEDRFEEVGRVTIPEGGWGEELFLRGDRAYVFVNEAQVLPVEPLESDIGGEEVVPEPRSGPVLAIHEIDLVAASIVRTLRIEGAYLSGRAVDATARVVVSSGPSELPFVFPSGPSSEEFAEEANRRVIAESELEDWLPGYELSGPGGEILDEGLLSDCSRVHRPGEFSGFNVISVLTLDLAGGLTPGDAAAVIADGQTVYASTENLYVATNRWFDPVVVQERGGSPDEDYTTAVHMFETPAGESANYLASGVVDGQLLNQFSLDEHDGHLRVVTTDGAPWTEATESFLVVLARDGEDLVQVGKVGNLGRGERVFSARLLGDRGYVVTFREIDPFYVLDLSDPSNPRVTGELKIPGFSSYLHPIDDDLVLGVGQAATQRGTTTGSKASLFDVSDPANPRELSAWTLPESYSAAESEHRAFQFIPDRNWAILPIEAWSEEFVGAIVLEIGAGGDVTEVGRITHLDDGAEPTTDCRIGQPEDFPEETELYWIAKDSAGVVLICDAGDAGGYGGHFCDVIAAADLESFGFDPGTAPISGDQRIEICWPEGNPFGDPILRTVVIDDTIWSVSASRVQGNGLDGLAVVAELAL